METTTSTQTTQKSSENSEVKQDYFELKEIEGTPFTAAHSKENEYLITLGKYAVDKFDNREEWYDKQQELKQTDWEMIIKVAGIAAEYYNEENSKRIATAEELLIETVDKVRIINEKNK